MRIDLLSILLSLTCVISYSKGQHCLDDNAIYDDSRKILSCLKPECFSSEGFVDKSMPPEEILKKKMEKLSGEEAAQRLIFAEMLASDCAESLKGKDLNQMALGIASVINKRVLENKSRDIKQIVFAKAQFRSSTGSCDVSKKAEFLCPTKNNNWEKIWIVAQSSWQEIKKTDPLKGRAKYYYFPKHFDKSVDCSKFKGQEVFENWKKGKIEVMGTSQSKALSECVRFFK